MKLSQQRQALTNRSYRLPRPRDGSERIAGDREGSVGVTQTAEEEDVWAAEVRRLLLAGGGEGRHRRQQGGVRPGQLDDAVVRSGAVLGARLGEEPATDRLQLLHGRCRQTHRRRQRAAVRG